MNNSANNFNDISLDVLRSEVNNTTKTITKVFDEKNYLNVRLDKGDTKKELKIRLLPMENGSPFVTVHFHNLKVPKEISPSGYKSYLCLEKNKDIDHAKYGNKCPFCELNRLAYEKFTQETDPQKKEDFKKISLSNIPREAKIVRCIERGKENEGVKFWKFNTRSDKTDPFNSIIEIAETRNKEAIEAGMTGLNILSIYKEHGGRDLKVVITEGNSAPQVMDVSVPSSLSNDENQMDQWINDPKKWQDVFTPKSYSYLQLVAQGKIPWYDKEAREWVDKDEFEAIKNGKINDANQEIKAAEQAILNNNNISNTDDFMKSLSVNDDDELPF